MSPFEVFKKINKSNEPLTDEELQVFNPWMAGVYYSNYPDTVMLANIADQFSSKVSKKHIAMFYSNTVPKGYRKHFWPKKNKDDAERISNIMEWFDCGIERAIEIESLIPNSVYSKLLARGNPVTTKKKGKK